MLKTNFVTGTESLLHRVISRTLTLNILWYISIFIVGLTAVDLLENSSWNYWIGFTLGALAQSIKSYIVKEEEQLANA